MKKGSKSYRLVIDSNIWISFLIGKGLRRLPYLISLAVESKADYLITGDKDILELELVKETKMISYVDFEKIVKG